MDMDENSETEREVAEIVPLQSSFLAAVGYDSQRRVLFLRFVSDSSLYAYDGVGINVYSGLVTSASKGAFFNESIRNRYTCTRVGGKQ
jgi:hypothetical protein